MQIKHRFTGAVLFEDNLETIKKTVEHAVIDGARLNGAWLDAAWLNGAWLIGARLNGASLDGASLDGARLDGASLIGARLNGAWLDGARLDGAWLNGARLNRASLIGASLIGARLNGAWLNGARLDGATYGEGVPTDSIHQVLGYRYPVILFPQHIKIGCELHSIEKWESMSREDIIKMSCAEAADEWEKLKPLILGLARAQI